jgi:hypothetical protein
MDIADCAGVVMSRMMGSQGDVDPGSEGWVTLPDGSGFSIMCYIDHDYIDYALVEVRTPFRYGDRWGTTDAGPTMVDYIFVMRHPGSGLDGSGPRRQVEWRNKPFEMFDPEHDWWEVYTEFINWCAGSLEDWHNRK